MKPNYHQNFQKISFPHITISLPSKSIKPPYHGIYLRNRTCKNVANFDKLLSSCNGYGSAYNPSRDSLKLPNLQTQHTDADASLAIVKDKKNDFDNATNTRRDLFKPIKKFATRLVNALDVTDAIDATVADARTINNKIQGTRVSDKPAPPPDDTKTAADGTSVSQQSYNLMIDHLDALITIVTAEPSYKPNEKGLTAIALNGLLTKLKDANKAVKDADTAYSNSRISCNKLLYTENTGLVPTSGEVKNMCALFTEPPPPSTSKSVVSGSNTSTIDKSFHHSGHSQNQKEIILFLPA